MRILILAALIIFPAFAQAGVYKCIQADGKTKYQQTPCAGGKHMELRHAGSANPEAAARAKENIQALSDRYEEDVRKHSEAQAAYGDKLKAKQQRKDRINQLIRGNKVVEGMSPGEVRKSWGSPSYINSYTSGDQWVYQRGDGSTGYVHYGRDGLVSGASQSASARARGYR